MIKNKENPLTPIAKKETEDVLQRLIKSREHRQRQKANSPNWNLDVLHVGTSNDKKPYLKNSELHK